MNYFNYSCINELSDWTMISQIKGSRSHISGSVLLFYETRGEQEDVWSLEPVTLLHCNTVLVTVNVAHFSVQPWL